MSGNQANWCQPPTKQSSAAPDTLLGSQARTCSLKQSLRRQTKGWGAEGSYTCGEVASTESDFVQMTTPSRLDLPTITNGAQTKIPEQEFIPPSQGCTISPGKQLEDSSALANYHAPMEATLCIALYLPDGVMLPKGLDGALVMTLMDRLNDR